MLGTVSREATIEPQVAFLRSISHHRTQIADQTRFRGALVWPSIPRERTEFCGAQLDAQYSAVPLQLAIDLQKRRRNHVATRNVL